MAPARAATRPPVTRPSPRLTVSAQMQRRFILGKQGLWPGRRWRGREGVADALGAGVVVQVDPLNVVARSHDIVLYSRVMEYQPEQLDGLLHRDRACFDWGGTVAIHPVDELPYWRVAMARKAAEPRRVAFAAEHAAALDGVRDALRRSGPLASRDFGGPRSTQWTYRSGKVAGQALYHLWLTGEVMTHSRRGFERV